MTLDAALRVPAIGRTARRRRKGVPSAGGKVQAVRIRNVPSWVVALDTPIEVLEYGTVLADVAFGG
ncbi:proline racemase family protein [Nonomuraea sp. NPDC049480]|uniref:proline racemase family protein n=1 Tax=Nonomuraea sp. NPDC049480 TaxID=3364353 RepID=UPI0037AEAD64